MAAGSSATTDGYSTTGVSKEHHCSVGFPELLFILSLLLSFWVTTSATATKALCPGNDIFYPDYRKILAGFGTLCTCRQSSPGSN